MLLLLTLQSCSNDDDECWMLQCNVGLLEKGTTAILKVRSRVWAETFVEVGCVKVALKHFFFFASRG